jgi:inner membrane protein
MLLPPGGMRRRQRDCRAVARALPKGLGIMSEGADMPNRNAHMVIGATAGVGGYIAVQVARGEEVKVSRILLWGALGAFVACIPDLLEPAIHSHHRAIMHSGVALCGLAYLTKRVMDSPTLPGEAKAACVSLIAAYASHGLADSCTPRGIPVLGI